jgi:hypothetical protein
MTAPRGSRKTCWPCREAVRRAVSLPPSVDHDLFTSHAVHADVPNRIGTPALRLGAPGPGTGPFARACNSGLLRARAAELFVPGSGLDHLRRECRCAQLGRATGRLAGGRRFLHAGVLGLVVRRSGHARLADRPGTLDARRSRSATAAGTVGTICCRPAGVLAGVGLVAGGQHDARMVPALSSGAASARSRRRRSGVSGGAGQREVAGFHGLGPGRHRGGCSGGGAGVPVFLGPAGRAHRCCAGWTGHFAA